MNDSSNDGNEATEGILADLANLKESAAANVPAPDRDVNSIMERLENIADAAQSLREPEAAHSEDAEPAAPKRRSARSAVANRGLVFEQFVRETTPDEDSEDADLDASDDLDEDDESQDAVASVPAFDPRNPFAAVSAPSPVTRQAPVVPHDGGLIFQVPKAELAEVVHIEDEPEDDSADYDDESAQTDDATQTDDAESTDESHDSGDSDSGSRRRRRGGRGRRSRGRDDDAEDSHDSQPAEETASAKDDSKQDDDSRTAKHGEDHSSDSDDDSDDHEEGGSRRRRRRRSRSTRGTDADEVTSVKGSTRLEAKRQRRREGREAGRRRPVITEAEFLARRESVERTMLVRENGNQTQLAVVEDGITVEHYLKENRQQSSLIGNVYLGKVQNVLPSMEAAFIDIGKGRNAVLYAGEVNWDALGMDGKARRIELALSSGDSVLVQVTKDPIGHKGARLTSQISLPGRFLVYVPGNTMTGISRKLPDVERARLKKLLKELVGDTAGVIVRTAAEGASDQELSRDIDRLAKRWETIEKKSKSTKVLAPQLLYSEPDMIVRIIRDVFNEDFSSLVIDGDGAWSTIHEYVESVAPDLLERVHRYEEDEDIFDHYRVEEQIQKALTRTVNLPSGGSLVIDRTEAMTVIDVNTGKFTGSGGNLEETVTRNNLEAAEEVIRQLRLRDIGGIIVVDFIDMVLESNRDLVLRRLVECLGRDRTKHQVAEVTSLGLVQMTRKRIGTGLAESLVMAGHDLSGRGLLLPGTEEDGSKAHHGNNSNSGSGRRERRRGKDSNRSDSGSSRNSGSSTGTKSAESESTESVTSDASRSAVAAIAKATLKKDENGEAATEADSTVTSAARTVEETASANATAPTSAKDDASAERTAKRSRSRSRRGSSKSAAAEQDSAASSGTTDAGVAEPAAQPAAESAAAPVVEEKAPAKEPADLPLMIGADATTKIAVVEPVKKPARRRKPAVKAEPIQETLPTSFVIIGED